MNYFMYLIYYLIHQVSNEYKEKKKNTESLICLQIFKKCYWNLHVSVTDSNLDILV